MWILTIHGSYHQVEFQTIDDLIDYCESNNLTSVTIQFRRSN